MYALLIIIIILLAFLLGFIWGIGAIPEKYFNEWIEDLEKKDKEMKKKWDLEDKLNYEKIH